MSGIGDGAQDAETLKTAAVEAALAVAGIGENNERINVLSADIDDTSKFVRGLDDNLIEVGKSISVMGDGIKDAGDEAEDSVEKFSEMEKKLLELASDEKIKAMEFTAEIKVAEVEAEGRKVEAVFNSIGTAVESTGETLSSMFGELGQFDSRTSSGFREMQDLVEKESDRRDKLIDSQTKHVDAMTDNLKARTEALRNGDGLVKIDSTGLEPALEMILWEILEKIQLRANAEGQEFLLGLNSGSSV